MKYTIYKLCRYTGNTEQVATANSRKQVIDALEKNGLSTGFFPYRLPKPGRRLIVAQPVSSPLQSYYISAN